MKRLLSMLLCLGLLLCGCGTADPEASTGETEPVEESTAATEPADKPNSQWFTMAYFPEEGFNPYLCGNVSNRMLLSLVFQGLFSVTKDGQALPVLCSGYQVSDDGLTHTLTVAQATFSDGAALQAADVEASLEAARDSDYYGGRFAYIDSIFILDESTVEITTDHPYENFPQLLDMPIVKQSQVEASNPLGTGPYILQLSGGEPALVRRTDWWCSAELPLDLPLISLESGFSASEVRDAFAFGDVGISAADPGSDGYAAYRGDYELWEEETGIMLYLVCNRSSAVFSNATVRSALSYAIDRSGILAQCYQGFGAIATLPASPSFPYYDRTLAGQITYDPDLLTDALADAGLSGRTVRMLVNKSDTVQVAAAKKIVHTLTECGLTVELQTNSNKYFKEELEKGNYDLYLGMTKLSPNMDLSPFFASNGALRYGGLADTSIAQVCLQALENGRNYYALHQMVLQDGQLIPILFRTYGIFAKRGLVEYLNPQRDWVFYYRLDYTETSDTAN